MRIFKKKRTFRKEFRRQVRLAVIAAVGFSVAFAWRNAIWDSANEFVIRFTQSTQIVMTDFLTALFITFIAIVILFITSRILREK